MGKCWMLLLEDKADYDSLAMEINTLPEVYRVKLTEYPSNPLEPIREVWEKWEKNISVDNFPEAAELWHAIDKCRDIVGGK